MYAYTQQHISCSVSCSDELQWYPSNTTTCPLQVLGSEQSYGRPSVDAREAVLWLGVKHRDKKALELHSREIAPAGTGMGEKAGHSWEPSCMAR